ncbi:tripartite tricarboxylate transporter substrate binding protein [Paralcaligenes sp. KSB-10]|uniref:Bug family tripartite tricarboxylate transporter substrate binding protein n=1 Tax=Paralcaligenes sp. KSB-10 TaxID=2901142 RepID=UPI001E427202|nr:tripartite tricarboxylate transporter substrate binding protein [Paralcaligenes sp. KSB-10]UHL65756.1 tripartite tricarboxylate transporter substrate binding protein [Paralcaligenes sp. KSB-10]
MTVRRTLLKSAVFFFAFPALALAGSPEPSYPSRSVTIIVPFAPGQSGDILARVLGEWLGKLWGKPVLVENKGGVGGSIGSIAAAHAAADGYTLLMGSTGPTVISPQLLKSAHYDSRKDFTPIIAVAGVPQMMLVAAKSKYKTMQDVIDDAKKNPGKLSYGSGGNGSLAQLTMEIFKHRAGVDITHIPYKGAAPAYTDLLAGRLQVMFDTTPAAIGFVKSGQLRFLAASTSKRTPAAPDVPTVSEAGLPGFNVLGWLGILAPAGLKPELQQRLNHDFQKALDDPGVRQRLHTLGMTPIGGSANEFKKFIDDEYEKFGSAIKAANIRLE